MVKLCSSKLKDKRLSWNLPKPITQWSSFFSFNCPCGIDQNNPEQPIYKKDEEIKIKSTKSRVGFKSEERVIGMLLKMNLTIYFSVHVTQHIIYPKKFKKKSRFKRSSKGSDYMDYIASVF